MDENILIRNTIVLFALKFNSVIISNVNTHGLFITQKIKLVQLIWCRTSLGQFYLTTNPDGPTDFTTRYFIFYGFGFRKQGYDLERLK